MIQPGMEKFAEVAVGRMINSLPEGILLALGVSLLLRLMPRQNSGTRFAVWLIALVGVAALPFLPFIGFSGSERFTLHPHSELVFQSFWALALLIFWLLLACAALARVAIGLLQIWQFRKSCAEISPLDLSLELRSLVEERKGPVRLLVSNKARVPAALGFLRPAVVLPAWVLQELSSAELRPILIHELAHLRRHDSWTNLFQKAVRAIFFFHPAVWWIDSCLSLEREMACDDAVLAASVNPCSYAASLIGLLEKSCSRRGWAMAQAAVTRAREASRRIARILSTKGLATTRIASPALGLAAGLFIACGGIALRAPRLLSFAPVVSAAHSSMQPRLIADDNTFPRGGAVVSASFHPMPRSGLVRNAEVTRVISPHLPTHQSAKSRKTRRAASQLLMTSFITYGNADRSMVIETSAVISGQSAPDQPYGAATGHKRDQPKTRKVQTLQFIRQDSAGYFRIWITMPGAGAIRPDLISLII